MVILLVSRTGVSPVKRGFSGETQKKPGRTKEDQAMKRRFFGFVLAMLLVGTIAPSGNALAVIVLDPWGAETYVWITYAPSYWGGFSPVPSIFDYDGGQGSFSSYSSASDFRGDGQAAAQLQGSGIMPVLKAESYVASSDETWGTWTTAFAIEGYTYSGTGAQTFNLSASLTGDINNPYAGDPLNGTALRADIYIFNAENFVWCTDPGTLLYEYGATTKADPIEFSADETGHVSLTDSRSFSVEPGETFYLWAMLEAKAQWAPSYADAFSTLDLQFDSTEGLTPASVPVPGSVILLGSGLIGLIGLRRRFKG